jgi:hypothetical protein
MFAHNGGIMILRKLASFVLLILSLNTFAGGGGSDVGSGGDLVKCVPSAANNLFGLYSLDFLIFANQTSVKPTPVQSWQESIFNIRRAMADKTPELLVFFDEYIGDILNADQSRRHVWEPTDYTLKEINDEDLPLSIQIPVNCRDNGKLQLVQAVIRQNPTFTGSKLVVFKYMPKIFEKMASESPLQLSFLLVHEFLWSITDNVDRNRRINWFLHSPDFHNLSRIDVIDRLLGMGLKIKEIPRILDVNGRGHFTTLQDALSKIRPNETLIVKEGVYSTAGAPIITPVRLIGEGDRQKIIITGSRTAPIFDVALQSNQTLTVENLTLSMITEENLFLEDISKCAFQFTSGSIVFKATRILTDLPYLVRLETNVDLSIDSSYFEWGAHGIDVNMPYKGHLSVTNSTFYKPPKEFRYTVSAIRFRGSCSDYSGENCREDGLESFTGLFENNIFNGIQAIIRPDRLTEVNYERVQEMFRKNKCPNMPQNAPSWSRFFCT